MKHHGPHPLAPSPAAAGEKGEPILFSKHGFLSPVYGERCPADAGRSEDRQAASHRGAHYSVMSSSQKLFSKKLTNHVDLPCSQ
jgi:hypothetical protein